jgi:hypothetical protein
VAVNAAPVNVSAVVEAGGVDAPRMRLRVGGTSPLHQSERVTEYGYGQLRYRL